MGDATSIFAKRNRCAVSRLRSGGGEGVWQRRKRVNAMKGGEHTRSGFVLRRAMPTHLRGLLVPPPPARAGLCTGMKRVTCSGNVPPACARSLVLFVTVPRGAEREEKAPDEALLFQFPQ